MKWFIKALKDYTKFSGRARRSEYWYFVLFSVIFAIVMGIMDSILETTFKDAPISLPYGYLFSLFILALIIPYLAVLVRRLHDVGKSGWWYFISWIPIVGGIWLFVLLLTDSNPGENQYGSNPKTGETRDLLDFPS